MKYSITDRIWNRLTIALGAAALLIGCGGPRTGEFPQSEHFDPSVVALTTADGFAYCSGVVLRDYIATAAHCVTPRIGQTHVLVAYRVDLNADHNSWRRVHAARVLAVNVTRDVALLTRPMRGGVARELRRSPVHMDERLVAVGHPFRFWTYTHQHVHVSHVERSSLLAWPTGPFFQVDGGIHPGMSGGPFFDRMGRVVGLVSFGVPGTTVDAGVPASSLRLLLARMPGARRTGAVEADQVMEFVCPPGDLCVGPGITPTCAVPAGTGL